MYWKADMEIRLQIPDDEMRRLQHYASALNKSPEETASDLLSGALFRLWMETEFGHVRDDVDGSQMTEDEISDFLEREKHIMRAEKRARKAS